MTLPTASHQFEIYSPARHTSAVSVGAGHCLACITSYPDVREMVCLGLSCLGKGGSVEPSMTQPEVGDSDMRHRVMGSEKKGSALLPWAAQAE